MAPLTARSVDVRLDEVSARIAVRLNRWNFDGLEEADMKHDRLSRKPKWESLTLEVEEEPAWQTLALCATNAGKDLNFFERNGHRQFKNSQLERALCAKCACREECLDWAVESGQLFGLWGGLDPVERAQL